MANKNNRPASDKASVAGKNNLKKKKEDEKYAQRISEERIRKQKLQEKRSAEIQKQRKKQSELEKKQQQKVDNKELKKEKRNKRSQSTKIIFSKIKYYTSKSFFSKINFKRVFIFVVLPIVIIIVGINLALKSVPANVPLSIRSYDYNGRTESENTAVESVFNSQQKDVMVKALNAKGNRKVKFYINSIINIDDYNETQNLNFGNVSSSDYVLVATVYDKSGNVLYRSLGLEKDREINNAKFFRDIPYGKHNVKVAVTAYDKETNQKIGTKYAKIQLAVGVK